MPELKSAKHELFCNEYIVDLNLKKAYMRSYPDAKDSSAQSNGSKLLTNTKVVQRIRELMAVRNKKMELTQEMVIQRIANIAFGNIGMVCVNTKDGLDIKSFDEMDEAELSLVQELNITPVANPDGGLLGYNKKVKLRDSLKALELLSRHMGLLDGKGRKTDDSTNVQSKLFEAIKKLSGSK